MTMYRKLTRTASTFIAAGVLIFPAFAGSARAAGSAVGTSGLVAPYGHLDIDPRDGVSYSRQARDQYECDITAVKRTGFDPTLENGGVPAGLLPDKELEYLRAEAACLEARGYRVKIVHAEP